MMGPAEYSISSIVDFSEGLIMQERWVSLEPLPPPGAPASFSLVPLIAGYLFRIGQQSDNEQVRGIPRTGAWHRSGQ